MIELSLIPNPINNDDFVVHEKVLAGLDKVALDCDGLLVMKNPGEVDMKFAVLAWVCSDDTGNYYGVIMQGQGPSSNLRECRHTYWGDDGYIFYVSGKLIASAFQELSKYYNDMV